MIKVTVKFFGPFRDLFGVRERVVDFPADGRLRRLLESLCDTPERQEQIFPRASAGRSHVVIMKNGAPIHGRAGLGTLLKDGDVIAVFPFLGGG